MPDEKATAAQICTYWNALVRDHDLVGIPLEGDLAATIQRLHAMNIDPPASARDRVRATLQAKITLHPEGGAPWSPAYWPMPHPSLSEPMRNRPQASAAVPHGLPRGRLEALAVLAVLVLVLAVISQPFIGSRLGGPSDSLVVIPAVIDANVATPPATPEHLPALAEYVGDIAFAFDGTALAREGESPSHALMAVSSAASGVAVADDGTVYVIDSKADQIRVFARDGSSIATWGGPGEGPGQFKFQQSSLYWGDLAIGPNGDLYIVDPFNSRIQVLDQDGTFLWAWGERGSEAGQFDKPVGIAIDTGGRVYITDDGNARLQIFDSEGQFLATWSPTKDDGGPFQGLADVAVDATGTVAVADYDQNLVYRFTAEGKVIDRLGAAESEPGLLPRPDGVATDAFGNLYVATGQQIHVFDRDGEVLGVIDGVASEPGQPMRLLYLTVGPDNVLYAADEPNRRVQIFRLLPPLTDARVGE